MAGEGKAEGRGREVKEGDNVRGSGGRNVRQSTWMMIVEALLKGWLIILAGFEVRQVAVQGWNMQGGRYGRSWSAMLMLLSCSRECLISTLLMAGACGGVKSAVVDLGENVQEWEERKR
eukprot:766000-Hanusia_phi.AAC.8